MQYIARYMCQIVTAEIAPAPALAPYVRCYSLREFDTRGAALIRPWQGSPEVAMPFFFRAHPLHLVEPATGRVIQRGSSGGVVGVSAQYNGEMTFVGHYLFFEVLFRATGFTKLFGIPASEITNRIVPGNDVLDAAGRHLHEQLAAASGLAQMKPLADAYLLGRLRRARALGSDAAVAYAAELVARRSGALSVEQLAAAANLSPRTLERRFAEQVGVAPKHFSSLTRFHQALARKLRAPHTHWTAVALESGYYDQMHLIKDFRRFAGQSPSGFLKDNPLTQETYLSRVPG